MSERLQVIREVAGGSLTAREAARRLALSERQILRLKRRWLEDSSDALEHRSRGVSKPWKLSEAVRRQIVDCARKEYPNVNDTQLHELLVTRKKLRISRESVRRVLREAGVAPSPARRRRRRGRSRKTGPLSART